MDSSRSVLNPGFSSSKDLVKSIDYEINKSNKRESELTNFQVASKNLMENKSFSEKTPLNKSQIAFQLKRYSNGSKPEIGLINKNKNNSISFAKESSLTQSKKYSQPYLKYAYHRKNAESQIFLNLNKKKSSLHSNEKFIQLSNRASSSEKTNFAYLNSSVSCKDQNKTKLCEFFTSYFNKKMQSTLSVRLKQQIKATKQLGVLLLG